MGRQEKILLKFNGDKNKRPFQFQSKMIEDIVNKKQDLIFCEWLLKKINFILPKHLANWMKIDEN